MTQSQPPPAIPTGGNGKYIAIVAVLLIGIIGIVVWKNHESPTAQTPPPPPPSPYDAAPTPHEEDDIPLPPPSASAAPSASTATPHVVSSDDGCKAKKCSGQATEEMEAVIAARGKQARHCYDAALANDSSLKGHVTIALRIGNDGRVCSSNIASNDMGTNAVAACVARTYANSAGVPAPKGGCVDLAVPLNFTSGGQ
jgi:cytoskeletal protein RodZ